MTWRVIDTGCEGWSCNLRGRKERIEVGTLVHPSTGYDLPSISSELRPVTTNSQVMNSLSQAKAKIMLYLPEDSHLR